MRKRKAAKWLSGLLALSMVATASPVAALAAEFPLKEAKSGEANTLSTAEMDVQIGENFPYIIQYTMKGDLAGKVFYGQTNEINTIKVNGTSIALSAADVQRTISDDGTKAVYVMNIQSGSSIDCVITAEISVEDNTASFDITEVKNNLTAVDANGYEVNPVQTIEIPNHSLISVRSSQSGANLKGAKMSSSTVVSGDKYYDVTASTSLSEDFIYGFVSNDELSAGLWSNSEHQGTHVASYITAGGACNTRVQATTESVDSAVSMGLASTEWYYDRMITSTVNGEQRTYVVEHEIMPSAKVAIAGDVNADGDIDWQDGAVAFRDIMHDPQGCEVVPDLVNYRIAMNFGSQAANPFLSNLDAVKRVYLSTDGLGQGVLLKGYGSEGHDSGHPDYGNIGTRIGGAEDMNTLLVEGKKMGALFGVHVNCSEMYAEAQAFDDELSRGTAGINSGWNWLDQGVGLNSAYDLASGNRENRFQELYDQVGNNLDFIYVDVWGNGVSSNYGENSEDAWASRMLAREINGFGWRLATEWGPTQEYDSTLQHWAADLAYGGAASKGENSEVMRFLRNHQKDSWIADYPSYSGAAQAPLLGGLNMTDFEGWQGRTDYDNYIKVMFRHNLITKYLQHYQVVDWVDGTPVTMGSTTWTPEMQITLWNTKDDTDDTEIVVSRDSNDYSNLSQYRSRTITVNGVVVSTGAVTGGDGSNAGNEKYLIPWNWDSNGEELASDDMKMYHWNTQGGQSTWTLTDEWQGLENVVVYKLTDEGKTDKKVVAVENNTITLDAEAETAYVVYKGEKAQLEVDWQTSKYIYDMGYNDTDVNSGRVVEGEGTAEIVDNESANNMLKLEGDVSVKTEIKNLIPGQKYAVYIGVDSRSDAKAHMTVTDGDKVLGANYATRSFVQNIVSSDQHHTGSGATVSDGISYFQNMYVFFTAESETATLTLKREAGEGATYFDDVRVVETEMDVVRETDEEGHITALYNDFEHNAQGIWPFVVSGPYNNVWGVTDNRIHLSERHDKYTQAGYMTKAVDDVLDGDWSVKVNALIQSNSMLYQTIPQNFRFEPGETYYVSFDYQMGSEGTYELRLGDGTNNAVQTWKLPEAAGKTITYGFSFTAGESGNNWIGIYSTGEAADTRGLQGNLASFSGYKDFILDNLKIEKAGMLMNTTYTEVTTAKDKISLDVSFIDEADKDTEVIWATSNPEVARVTSDGDVYFVGFGSAMITATAILNGKTVTLSSAVYQPDEYVSAPTYLNAWANTQETYYESSGAANVTDGTAGTIWHSNYSTGFTVSESNPAIITVQLQEDISEYITKAFQQRSGNNGLVQKYECIVGDTFNSSTHTISGTEGVDKFTTGVVTTKNSGSTQIETLELPEGTKGHYLQIRVLQGSGNFASIADIIINTTISYDTEEERQYMADNKAIVDAKEAEERAEAQSALAAAVTEAESAYKLGAKEYTADSWAAFEAAYQAASNPSETATPAELKQLQWNLQTALQGLKKAENVDPPETETDKQPESETEAPAAVKVGDTVIVKKVLYKVTDAEKKTVAAVKGTDKKVTSVNIPAAVKVNGVTCKVTQISAKAFRGFAKLKKVTIGANVTTIGKQSFQNCKKLAKVAIKGTSLKSVKKGAFKKTGSKMKVVLPKKLKGKQRTKLVKALKKSGISKKAVIK